MQWAQSLSRFIPFLSQWYVGLIFDIGKAKACKPQGPKGGGGSWLLDHGNLESTHACNSRCLPPRARQGGRSSQSHLGHIRYLLV